MEWTLFLMLPQIVVGVARVKQTLRQSKQTNDLCVCACSCRCFAVRSQQTSFPLFAVEVSLCGHCTREIGKFSYFMLFYGLLHMHTHPHIQSTCTHLNSNNCSLSCRKETLRTTYGPTCSSLVFGAHAKVSGNTLHSPT